MRGKLGVGAHLPKLRDLMEKDTQFLKRQNVVDYSLLVMVQRTERRIKLDHQTWVSEHQDALHASFEELKAGPGAAFFEEMTFDEYCTFADKDSAARVRIPKDTFGHGYALPLDGFKSHRIDDDFQEIIGEERYFIGIIDFLVPFDTKKSAEHTYKTMVGQTNHSVVPPADYASRFVAFATQSVDYHAEEISTGGATRVRSMRRGASSISSLSAAEGSDAEGA
mmetsp:Transcript_1791/g.3813  ORF Transcript_1791/g.3813 Transcript_1791/m.3813 type:complete len:223 (-) Transcript_1791:19-687(-)